MLLLLRFSRFFKIQNIATFYVFFAVFRTFSRTMRYSDLLYLLHNDNCAFLVTCSAPHASTYMYMLCRPTRRLMTQDVTVLDWTM